LALHHILAISTSDSHFMNFQDFMSLTNVLLTLVWMLVTYVLFQLQAQTFQVQAETFREQQKVTELSLKKFIYDIKPAVEAQFYKTDDYRLMEILKIQLSVIFKESHIVKNIRDLKTSALPEGGMVTGPLQYLNWKQAKSSMLIQQFGLSLNMRMK